MNAVETLIAAGVPLGGPRRRAAALPPAVELGRAVEEALLVLRADERVALTAWLSALRHHWPSRFSALLGAAGAERLARLRAEVEDLNRYLKLRRIAIENLAEAA